MDNVEQLTEEQLAAEQAAFTGETIVSDNPAAEEPIAEQGQEQVEVAQPEAADATVEADTAEATLVEAKQIVEKALEDGYTPEQVKAILQKVPELENLTSKQFQQVFGKFGEIQKSINEIKAKGGSGQQVRITKDSFKRLGVEYEDLAAVLADDLNEALLGVGGNGNGVTLESLEPVINERLIAVQETMELKLQQSLLKIQHPDWITLRETPEFKSWKDKLPANEFKELDETQDASLVSDYFTRFKTERNVAQDELKRRRDRLQNAITPKGSPAQAKSAAETEEEAFARAGAK